MGSLFFVKRLEDFFDGIFFTMQLRHVQMLWKLLDNFSSFVLLCC